MSVPMFLLVAAWGAYGKGAYWTVSRGGQWSIGIYQAKTLDRWSPAPGAANPVLTASDVTDATALFVADPFMLQAGSNWFMFFEVYDMRTDQGDIALATSPDGLTWQYQRIVLDEPFHLSYPYVFEHEGQYYLVPESYEAGQVRLYRAKAFPYQWEFVGQMIQGSYLDPCVFRHDGRWWLMAEGNPPKGNDTLCLFFADDLLGPWTEHPLSPVVRGDRNIARPGGRVMTDSQGRLYRFTQDCDPYYGNQIWGFRITELTPTAYREEPLSDQPLLGPAGSGWNADGMHQLDPHRTASGDYLACVDGQRMVRWIGLRR
ncbi:MAG TPA: hypothetical protein VF184_09170 [Phycisphaeraceae bacterium]